MRSPYPSHAGRPAHGGPRPWRRATFLSLAGLTLVAASGLFGTLLGADGIDALDVLLWLCFTATLPWTVLNFWNAAIGWGLMTLRRDPVATVFPAWRGASNRQPTARVTNRAATRIAVVMPVFNEDPDQVTRHLRVTLDSLDEAGLTDRVDIHLLSDSTDPEIAAREARLFAAWRAGAAHPERLHYRRRPENAGQKMGNVWEFLDRRGDSYDFMLLLDADSLMDGATVRRMILAMERDPALGILQSLVTALPGGSPFARLFQFGMRHGMRAFTLGAAWWQGDDGPYWGHNALIRVDAFRRHCRLPTLRGRSALSGMILSHDQVEAVMMRRAGYAVRVIPEELGSHEANPPTLAEYVTRDLRWCQGNMQYWGLLAWPGLRAIGRLQLAMAILMYVAGPAWILFVLAGFGKGTALAAGLSLPTLGQTATLPWLGGAAASGALWPVLMFLMLSLVFAPKLAGYAETLLDGRKADAWGGRGAVLTGVILELPFSVLLTPIVAFKQTSFLARLFLTGRAVRWRAQNRDARVLAWGEALNGLWAPMLLGGLLTAGLAVWNPAALPWAAPIVLGLVFAVPFAVGSANPRLGTVMARFGLASTPEERAGTPIVRLAIARPEPAAAETTHTDLVAGAAEPAPRPELA